MDALVALQAYVADAGAVQAARRTALERDIQTVAELTSRAAALQSQVAHSMAAVAALSMATQTPYVKNSIAGQAASQKKR